MANQTEMLIPVTQDEAIVLFEFLQRYSGSNKLTIDDQAEQRALWNLCCTFEKFLTAPFEKNYSEILEEARKRLRDEAR